MSEDFDKSREWGVVQQLAVEADTYKALEAALVIAARDNRTATHYRVEVSAKNGNTLVLLWSNGDCDMPLPYRLDGGEQMAAFTWEWLSKSASYPPDQPDTDGSIRHGYRVSNDFGYIVARIAPAWIVYGK